MDSNPEVKIAAEDVCSSHFSWIIFESFSWKALGTIAFQPASKTWLMSIRNQDLAILRIVIEGRGPDIH